MLLENECEANMVQSTFCDHLDSVSISEGSRQLFCTISKCSIIFLKNVIYLNNRAPNSLKLCLFHFIFRYCHNLIFFIMNQVWKWEPFSDRWRDTEFVTWGLVLEATHRLNGHTHRRTFKTNMLLINNKCRVLKVCLFVKHFQLHRWAPIFSLMNLTTFVS